MKLGIVVPCFNEEQVLPETSKRLSGLIAKLVAKGDISEESQIVFVDDGSTDRTWDLICELASRDAMFSGIKLSRNRGHQNALIAGLFGASGDAIVSVDADLQDDIAAIEEMVERSRGGADIVYGVRNRRTSDSILKRLTAEIFYKILNALGVDSVFNHADFRLMSRRAIESLKQYSEVNLYLRGIIPLLGFKSEIVYYDRQVRFAGESKYTLRKMIALALNAVTSFSITPLRLITLTGFVVFAGSMMVALWSLWVRLVSHSAVPGWTSIVLPLYFLGGVQLFCLGMIGEYLGKTYSEVKSRPRYIIETSVSGRERCNADMLAKPDIGPAHGFASMGQCLGEL